MRKKEPKIWLDKAFEDLQWTEANLREKIYYGACFTAQQSVEKALKAYLILKEGRFDKIHDVVDLLDDCKKYNKDFGLYRKKIAKLTFYYIQSRYPDISEIDKFTKKEAESASETAKELLDFVKTKINL